MAATAHGDCTRRQAGRNHVQSRHAPPMLDHITCPHSRLLPDCSRWKPIAAPVRSDAEIETSITSLGREPGGGLVFAPDAFTTLHRASIILLAARNNVPAVYSFAFVRDGGLLSYGPDRADMYRRSASYVDRILRGEKPADLPVQLPIKFEMAINLKTAKALGLTFRKPCLWPPTRSSSNLSSVHSRDSCTRPCAALDRNLAANVSCRSRTALEEHGCCGRFTQENGRRGRLPVASELATSRLPLQKRSGDLHLKARHSGPTAIGCPQYSLRGDGCDGGNSSRGS